MWQGKNISECVRCRCRTLFSFHQPIHSSSVGGITCNNVSTEHNLHKKVSGFWEERKGNLPACRPAHRSPRKRMTPALWRHKDKDVFRDNSTASWINILTNTSASYNSFFWSFTARSGSCTSISSCWPVELFASLWETAVGVLPLLSSSAAHRAAPIAVVTVKELVTNWHLKYVNTHKRTQLTQWELNSAP